MDTAMSELHNITYPFLVIHGTNDHIVDITGSKLLHERSTSNDKTIKIYEGQGHEVHNDTEMNNEFNEVYQWMNKRLTSKKQSNVPQSSNAPRTPASHY